MAVVQYTYTHTNNTENDAKQTIHRTTQKYIEQHKKYIEQHKKYIEQHKKYIEQHKDFEECGPCPVFATFCLGICLTTEEKHGKTLVKVVIHKHTSHT